MSDELDKLKSALQAATPPPDPEAKAGNIALAQKNFAALQGSQDQTRPISDRPHVGFFRKGLNMLSFITTRQALTAHHRDCRRRPWSPRCRFLRDTLPMPKLAITGEATEQPRRETGG